MALQDPAGQERMRRIRVLLTSRFDYLPQIRIARSEGMIDGPAESRYVPCECAGRWRCGDCDGTGLRKKRKDDQGWDEYVEMPIDEARVPRLSAGTLDLRADIARIDKELRKLRVDALAREGIVADEEPWVVKLDAMEKQGSYREMRRGLARLEAVCPRLRWALRVVYESSLAIELPANIDTLESLAVAFLALHMRGEVRIPQQFEEEFAADKRRSIEELLGLGWNSKRIAKTLGLPVAKVKHVAKGRKA